MRKIKNQSALTYFIMGFLILYATHSLAQSSPVKGNPVDTLPPVIKPTEKKAEVNVVKPDAANKLVQRILAVRLKPSKFSIIGVKSVPFQEISTLYMPLVGKEITVADIIKVTNQIKLIKLMIFIKNMAMP